MEVASLKYELTHCLARNNNDNMCALKLTYITLSVGNCVLWTERVFFPCLFWVSEFQRFLIKPIKRWIVHLQRYLCTTLLVTFIIRSLIKTVHKVNILLLMLSQLVKSWISSQFRKKYIFYSIFRFRTGERTLHKKTTEGHGSCVLNNVCDANRKQTATEATKICHLHIIQVFPFRRSIWSAWCKNLTISTCIWYKKNNSHIPYFWRSGSLTRV